MKWFKSKNATEQKPEKEKKKTGKAITLNIEDKHEPFGTITIEEIKSTLEDEDFAKLQSLYFYMMRDLKIASVVLARKQPLLALDYTITTDNEAFKEWLDDNVDLSELITQCSSAIYYGVSLSNVSYTVDDLKLKPKFKHISSRYLYAEKGKKLKDTIEHLYIKQADKKLFLNKLAPDDIVFHKHAIDIGEITDFSVASKLVWYFSLKHIVLAHNLQYFDNIATPPLIAKTSGDEDDLIQTLYDLKSSSVGVFNTDDVIEYLNVNSKADFLAFIEYIDRQIATFVLGNTLSTGEGKNGSRAQSQTHENRQLEVKDYDAKLIAKTITDYLNKLEQLNFGNASGVKFAFDLKQKKDLEKLSVVVKNLSDSGFELDPEDIESQFGIKIIGYKSAENSDKNDSKTSKSNNAVLAGTIPGTTLKNNQEKQSCSCCGLKKHDNNSVKNAIKAPINEDFLASQKPKTIKVENALVNAVETALKQASSYEDAYQTLLGLYQDMPLDELEETLFTAIANSQLLANAEIENEQESEGE